MFSRFALVFALFATFGSFGETAARRTEKVDVLVWAPLEPEERCASTERVLAFQLAQFGISARGAHDFFPDSDHWDETMLTLSAALRGVAAVVRVDNLSNLILGYPEVYDPNANPPLLCRLNVEATVTPAAFKFKSWTSGVDLDGVCLSPLMSTAMQNLAVRLAYVFQRLNPAGLHATGELNRF